jgi:UDP-N-acetylmuramoyl-tripeptide--D-alanyl-D-alanine ligase
MIATALGASLKVLSTQENYNNEIGVPQTLLQLEPSHQAAVIEMGMRGRGQIEYLAKIARPDIGVITNIGPQHIELLGSLENIAAAKAELIQELPASGTAILPADDPMYDFLQKQTSAKIIGFGQSAAAQYRVIKSTFDERGYSFCRIETPRHGILELQLALPGAHNAVNAAAALATADACGIDLHLAAQALKNLEVPGARMQLRRTEKAVIIDDCYNAGPLSMRAALEVLNNFPAAKRRVAVLGSMLELGEWSENEHRAIGLQANEIAHVIIGVGEATKVLLEAAQKKGHTATHWFENAEAAANWLPAHIQQGDIILIKGSRSIGLEKVVEALHAS